MAYPEEKKRMTNDEINHAVSKIISRQKRYISTTEACEILGVKKYTLMGYKSRGNLRAKIIKFKNKPYNIWLKSDVMKRSYSRFKNTMTKGLKND